MRSIISSPQALSQGPKPIATRLILRIIAAFYAYGALVHVLNMLSLTGFDWSATPAKWQALDVAYLVLDVTVVVGLLRGARIGIWAFFCAALSQIALYTVFRDWVLNVPDAFRRSLDEVAYLDVLVIFHVVTCILLSAAIYLAHSSARSQSR